MLEEVLKGRELGFEPAPLPQSFPVEGKEVGFGWRLIAKLIRFNDQLETFNHMSDSFPLDGERLG